MGPSPSPERSIGPRDVELLFDIAETTLALALVGRRRVLPALEELPASVRRPMGVFVTLEVDGELNGCVGTVEATEPLAHAVARLALSAAFSDQRMPALRHDEYRDLTIKLSLLSPLTPLPASTRADLIDALRPGIDGLAVSAGSHHGLFLPSVWEQLPDADDFLDHLWRKAGLVPRTWPAGIRFERFTSEHHRRRVGAGRGDTAA